MNCNCNILAFAAGEECILGEKGKAVGTEIIKPSGEGLACVLNLYCADVGSINSRILTTVNNMWSRTDMYRICSAGTV